MKNKEQEYQIGDKTTTNLQRVYNYMSKNGNTELNSLKIEAKPEEAVEEPKEELESERKAVEVKSEEQKETINTKKNK